MAPIYTVIFRSEPENQEEEEIIRLNFATPDAMMRHLPEIINSRLDDVADAIEECGMIVEDVVAYLSDLANRCKVLKLGKTITAVCATQTVYV